MDRCFPDPNMTSSNVSLCPQLEHIQLTAIEEERDQNVLTFFKLDLENIVVFLRKKKKRLIDYLNTWR